MRENGPESAPEGHRRAPRTDLLSYLRVSTDKQGASGLDPEAQREAFDRHIRAARRKVRAITGTARAGRHRPKASRLPPPPWVLLSPEAIRGHRARRLGSSWRSKLLVLLHPLRCAA